MEHRHVVRWEITRGDNMDKHTVRSRNKTLEHSVRGTEAVITSASHTASSRYTHRRRVLRECAPCLRLREAGRKRAATAPAPASAASASAATPAATTAGAEYGCRAGCDATSQGPTTNARRVKKHARDKCPMLAAFHYASDQKSRKSNVVWLS